MIHLPRRYRARSKSWSLSVGGHNNPRILASYSRSFGFYLWQSYSFSSPLLLFESRMYESLVPPWVPK